LFSLGAGFVGAAGFLLEAGMLQLQFNSSRPTPRPTTPTRDLRLYRSPIAVPPAVLSGPVSGSVSGLCYQQSHPSLECAVRCIWSRLHASTTWNKDRQTGQTPHRTELQANHQPRCTADRSMAPCERTRPVLPRYAQCKCGVCVRTSMGCICLYC
jgi:hypothetical protein